MRFPLCSRDTVSRRYLVGVLDILKRKLSEDGSLRDLLKCDAGTFSGISHSLADQALAALVTRNPEHESSLVRALAVRIAVAAPAGQDARACFENDGHLARVLGEPDKFASREDTAAAFAKGLALLARACPSAAAVVDESVLFALGIRSEPGQIDAFSDPKLPGFIAFAPNNPPAVIAEQILHEGLHTRLWCYTQLNVEVEEWFRSLPALFSPFVRKGRSGLRVVHGVLTYAAVLSFWRQLQLLPQGLGGADASTIHHRVSVLEERVQSGLAALAQVMDRSKVHELASAVGVGAAVALPTPQIADPSIVFGVLARAQLPPIQKAEALLAAAGTKVSRLVLPVDALDFLDAYAKAGGRYCLNPRAVMPAADSLAGGFSNTATAAHSIDLAPPGSDAYVYLGANAQEVIAACRLDDENAAGDLLGIPECCRAHFRIHWDSSRQGTGDLFAKLLEAASPSSDGSAECNAAAMYLGRGLCWHFPCALTCDQTKQTVRRRHEALRALNPILADRLTSDLHGTLMWSSHEGYCFLPGCEPSVLVPESARWLSGKGFYDSTTASLTPSEWAVENVDHVRRVVAFS